MGRGFLAGGFWGALIGLLMLLVSNETLDRQQLSFPRPEAAAVDVPAGTEFDQARPDSEPVVPGMEGAPSSEPVAGVTPPPDEGDTPPSFDTSALEVPQPSIDAPGGLGDIPEVAEEVEIDVTGPGADSDGARPANPDLTVPVAPGAAPDTTTDAPDAAEAPASEEAAPDAPESGAADSGVDAPGGQALADTAEDAAPADIGQSAPVAAPSDAPEIGMVDAGEDAAPAGMGEASDGVIALTEPSQPVLISPSPEAGMADTGSAAAPEAPAPDADGAAAPEAPDQMAGTAEQSAPDASIGAADETTAEAGLSGPDGEGPEIFVPETQEVFDNSDQSGTAGEETTDLAQADTEPTLNRLPQIGDDEPSATTLPTIRRLPGQAEEDETAEADTAEEEIPPSDDAGSKSPPSAALDLNAVPFENTEESPLVSVVIIGGDASMLSPVALSALPDGVTFGIDAGQPNADEAASLYRAAGREIVLIPALPEGARPQDVEQSLRVNFDTVPQAVAIMDINGRGFQADREAVAQIVDVVAETGHGLITFPRGLNTAHQRAERAGVPTGLIFRDLDGDGETQDQIVRGLDRAAFRARQNEAVILVARATDPTLAALAQWAAEPRNDGVRLAPISAALLDR